MSLSEEIQKEQKVIKKHGKKFPAVVRREFPEEVKQWAVRHEAWLVKQKEILKELRMLQACYSKDTIATGAHQLSWREEFRTLCYEGLHASYFDVGFAAENLHNALSEWHDLILRMREKPGEIPRPRPKR
jgi:hypothetical protein